MYLIWYIFILEILYRFCHQCHTFRKIYARRTSGLQVSPLANCRVYTLRVFYHDPDCAQHYPTYDEGKIVYQWHNGVKTFLKKPHLNYYFFHHYNFTSNLQNWKITCEIVIGVWKFKCDFTMSLDPLCIIWDYIMTCIPIFESFIEILFLSQWHAYLRIYFPGVIQKYFEMVTKINFQSNAFIAYYWLIFKSKNSQEYSNTTINLRLYLIWFYVHNKHKTMAENWNMSMIFKLYKKCNLLFKNWVIHSRWFVFAILLKRKLGFLKPTNVKDKAECKKRFNKVKLSCLLFITVVKKNVTSQGREGGKRGPMG